jgi:hypothetical protein
LEESKEKQDSESKKIQDDNKEPRTGKILIDRTNAILFFKFEEMDGTRRKLQLNTKTGRDPDDYARICILLARRCEEGMHVTHADLVDYRSELVNLNVAGLTAVEKSCTSNFTPKFNRGAAEFCGPKYAEEEDTEARADKQIVSATETKAEKKDKKRKKDKAVDGDASKKRKSKHKGEAGTGNSQVVPAASLLVEGRDASKKNSSINGTYVPIPEGYEGHRAYRNSVSTVSRVLYYHASRGRWKISESLGESAHFAHLFDQNGDATPADVDLKNLW